MHADIPGPLFALRLSRQVVDSNPQTWIYYKENGESPGEELVTLTFKGMELGLGIAVIAGL